MDKTKNRPIPVFCSAGRVLSDAEVLRTKHLLRVDEAATILRVTPRHVRELVKAGRLRRHPENPLRVTAKSVSRYLGGGEEP